MNHRRVRRVHPASGTFYVSPIQKSFSTTLPITLLQQRMRIAQVGAVDRA